MNIIRWVPMFTSNSRHGAYCERVITRLFFFGRGFVSHFHIDVTTAKLVEHLGESSGAGFVAFGVDDLADVIVLLIRRTRFVRLEQILLFECVQNIVGHGMAFAFCRRSTFWHTRTAFCW